MYIYIIHFWFYYNKKVNQIYYNLYFDNQLIYTPDTQNNVFLSLYIYFPMNLGSLNTNVNISFYKFYTHRRCYIYYPNESISYPMYFYQIYMNFDTYYLNFYIEHMKNNNFLPMSIFLPMCSEEHIYTHVLKFHDFYTKNNIFFLFFLN